MDERSDFVEEVLALAHSGRVEAAGELLLEESRATYESDPRMAHSACEALFAIQLPPLLLGYTFWASGAVSHLSGDSSLAEKRITKAVDIFRQLGRHDLADRARLLLTDVLAERLKLTEAMKLGRELARRFLSRGDQERAAAALANTACALDACDRVLEAQRLWKKAARLLSESSPRKLLVLANLANVIMARGRLRAAWKLHQHIHDQAAASGMDATSHQALLNAAEALCGLGEISRALESWQKVARWARLKGHKGLLVHSLLLQAQALLDIGDLPGCENVLEDAESVLSNTGMYTEIAKLHRLKAALAAARGDSEKLEEACRWLETKGLATQADLATVDSALMGFSVAPGRLALAAARLEKTGLGSRAKLAASLKARLHAIAGESAKAREEASRLLSSRRNLPALARLVALHVLGTTTGNMKTLQKAVKLARAICSGLSGPSLRMGFSSLAAEAYISLAELYLSRNAPSDRTRAMSLLEELRAMMLAGMPQAALAKAGAELGRWSELVSRVRKLLAELEEGEVARKRAASLKLKSELKSLLRRLRKFQAHPEEQKRTTLGKLLLSPDKAASTAKSVGKLLGKDELIAEFIPGRYHVWVLARVRDGTWSYRLSLRPRELAAAVARLDLLADEEGLHEQYEETLQQLGAALLEPILHLIRRCKRMWIVPWSYLFKVPWAILPTGKGQLLLEICQVGLTPSVASLEPILAIPPTPPESRAAVACASRKLIWARREAVEAQRLWPGTETILDPTYEELLNILKAYQFVHLSGHALDAGVAPVAGSLRLQDGFFTALDLIGHSLAARVVSLGACSVISLTGDGLPTGLLAALLSGGASAVVGPSRAVEDEVAYHFGTTWLKNLSMGEEPGEAFRTALLAVRRRFSDIRHSAPFTFFGNLRAWRWMCS